MMVLRELYTTLLGVFISVSFNLKIAEGHAKMTEPPMRSSMWRFGFDTPINYNDNELFCGGIQRFRDNGGQCGVCGDPYDDPNPEHEAGGRFATGKIVRYYPQKVGRIPVTIDVTAHHKGFFEFRICANNDVKKRVMQQCLDKNLLIIEEGEHLGHPYRFFPKDNGLWNVTLRIPPEITCTQCVLQMRYKAGNSWGVDATEENKGPCLGCGIQEEFRNCADISIGYPEPPSTTVATTTASSTTAGKPVQKQLKRNSKTVQSYKPKTFSNSASVPKSERKAKTSHRGNVKRRYKNIHNIDRLMNGGNKDFIFRVRRIEETLTLLDDTERILAALETNLDKNREKRPMSGLEYVKLYAGLVWTKRKIRHLGKLINRLSSKFSHLKHASKNMKSKSSKLSNKKRVGSKHFPAKGAKYTKKTTIIVNKATERPVYRKRPPTTRVPGKTTWKPVRKLQNHVKTTPKVITPYHRENDKFNATKLVSEFPAVNYWGPNTTQSKIPVSPSPPNVARSSDTRPVIAPNAMPWSPSAIPMPRNDSKKQQSAVTSQATKPQETISALKTQTKPFVSLQTKSPVSPPSQNEVFPTLQVLGLSKALSKKQISSSKLPKISAIVNKIRALTKDKNNPLSHWIQAELKNRMLHHQYIKKVLQEHKQNENSLIAVKSKRNSHQNIV